MRLLKFIVTGTILFSCSTNKDKGSEFQKYLESLETLIIPFNINSDRGIVRSKNYDTTLFKKFRYGNAFRPHGKIFVNDSIVLTVDFIAGDSSTPAIMTFDQSGHKLDSLMPYRCDQEFAYQCDEYAVINENKEIVVIDSVRKWKIKNGLIIKGSEELTVGKIVYKIDGEGRFRKGNRINMDSVEISARTLEFYRWYTQVVKAQLKEEYQPDVVESDSGMTTLNYDKAIENFRRFKFSDNLIKEMVDRYELCKKNLASIKYSDYQFLGRDESQSMGCDFMGELAWIGSNEQHEISKIYWLDFWNTTSATVYVELDAPFTFAHVSFKRLKNNWQIDGIKIAPMPGD